MKGNQPYEYNHRKAQPDEGQIEWSNKVRVGYMDQHAVLESGQSIRDVLREPFSICLMLN